MKLWHLLAALCIAALATLAIIPALTILRAPMPTLDAVTATAPCVPHYGVNACERGHSIPEVNVPVTATPVPTVATPAPVVTPPPVVAPTPTTTAPAPGCPYSALSVTPDYASGYPQTHFVVSDGTGPTMLVHAHGAAEALDQARTSWADSYGEMSCSS